jgi:hypothetical protein
MSGMLFGVLMLVSSAGTSPDVLSPPAAAERADFTYELPERTTRDLPGGLLKDLSRPGPERGLAGSAQAMGAKRPKVDRILAVAAGACLGFVTGGRIGFAVTPKRGPYDDTSGLKGVMIGAPIGGVVGALIGYRLSK